MKEEGLPRNKVNESAQAAQHCFCWIGLAGQWLAGPAPLAAEPIIPAQHRGVDCGKRPARVGVVMRMSDAQTTRANKAPGERGLMGEIYPS